MKKFTSYYNVTVQDLKNYVTGVPDTQVFYMQKGGPSRPGCLIEQYRQHVTGKDLKKAYWGSMRPGVEDFLRKIIKVVGKENATGRQIKDAILDIA